MIIKEYTIPTTTQQIHNKIIVVANSLQQYFGLLGICWVSKILYNRILSVFNNKTTKSFNYGK